MWGSFSLVKVNARLGVNLSVNVSVNVKAKLAVCALAGIAWTDCESSPLPALGLVRIYCEEYLMA